MVKERWDGRENTDDREKRRRERRRGDMGQNKMRKDETMSG